MDLDPPPLPPIEEALLVPELAEVYLLLDNLSAVASKEMPDLSKDPVFAGPTTWVEKICDIRWPPDPDHPQSTSLSAAKLIRAKDALNGAAWPATGASIAFTLMLSGDARSGTSNRPFWKRLAGIGRDRAGKDPRFVNPRDRLCSGEPFTRMSLATIAYPTLHRNMGRNRIYYNLINAFLVFALILTCLLSWDVAAGSALLNRVNALKTIQGSPSKDGKVAPVPVVPGAGGSAATDLTVPLQNLEHWVDANTYLTILVGGWKQWPATATGKHPPEPTTATNVEWAAVLIGVLAGTILPICYGVLGASAAVVRNVVARISATTLMPRDLILSLVQLGLGAVIGACVGLFVTSDGNGGAGENGLLGPVTCPARRCASWRGSASKACSARSNRWSVAFSRSDRRRPCRPRRPPPSFPRKTERNQAVARSSVMRALPWTRVVSTVKPASAISSDLAVSMLIQVAGPVQPRRDSLSSATTPAPLP